MLFLSVAFFLFLSSFSFSSSSFFFFFILHLFSFALVLALHATYWAFRCSRSGFSSFHPLSIFLVLSSLSLSSKTNLFIFFCINIWNNLMTIAICVLFRNGICKISMLSQINKVKKRCNPTTRFQYDDKYRNRRWMS